MTEQTPYLELKWRPKVWPR